MKGLVSCLLSCITVVSCASGMYRLTEKENEELQKTCGTIVDGRRANAVFKVFGGTAARKNEMPWALQLSDEGYHCSATLISPYHFITAAHCVNHNLIKKKKIDPKQLYIIAGSPCARCTSKEEEKFGKGRRVNVTNIVLPKSAAKKLRGIPFGSSQPDTNDILIGELEEGFNSSNSNIRPICVPRPGVSLPHELTVFGFGFTKKPSKDSGKLHSFTISTKDVACRYWPTTKFNRFGCSNIIAVKQKIAELPKGKQSVCAGDSGGGATAVVEGRHVLFGVASTNSGDFCSQNEPKEMLYHKFSRVMYHHDFLCAHLGVCPREYDYWVAEPEEAIDIGRSRRTST